MPSLTEHSVSFIVRIWREPGQHESDPALWRGSVEDVESEQRVYYTDVFKMMEFLKERVAKVGIDMDIPARDSKGQRS